MNQILGCKSDCNFVRLLSESSNFTLFCDPSSSNNCSTNYFSNNVVQYLPSSAASQCRLAFPSLISTNVSAANLVNNIGIKLEFLFYFIHFLLFFI